MRVCGLAWLAFLVASHAHVAWAADRTVSVSAQAQFRTNVTRANVPVVFSQNSGEVVNPIPQNAIEAQCEVARQTGQTDKHPVFEAGHGKPVKIESLRFSNATQGALLSTAHALEFVRRQGRLAEVGGVYDCTYRIRHHHWAEIKNTLVTAQTLTIDLTKGIAHRRVAASCQAVDLQRDAERVVALAPVFVGRDGAAGIPCVLRCQPLGAQGRIDRCIAEDLERHLPPALRYLALGESVPSADGTSIYRWPRTDQVVLNAAVDAVVFTAVRGIAVKEAPC